MKPSRFKIRLTCLGVLLMHSVCFAMTIDFGSGGGDLIAEGESWRFFPGQEAPSTPSDAWTESDFDDSHWEVGLAGFGYGDGDDATVLSEMRNNYVTVYLRKAFSISNLPPDAPVELVIDYDDGFVAYLNGHEVKRKSMPNGPVTFETRANSHEAGSPEVFNLGTVSEVLVDGTNVLAVEGHNVSKSSSDFTLAPALRIASDTVKNGAAWIVETETVKLQGHTDAPEAVTVEINDLTADFDPSDGSWTGQIVLNPGWNLFTARALNGDGNMVDYRQIQFIYVPSSNHASGTLTDDATWSGTMIVDSTVTVPPGRVLTIEPGTMVLINEDAGLVVQGQLLANGTEDDLVHFTHYRNDTTWDRIMFVEAEDSRLAYCLFEFADCEGDHKRYYDNDCDPTTPLPKRNYREAIVVLASHVDIEYCVFQHLPDESRTPEGDAIAVISDDPDHPGDATANIIGCQFLSIGQGVHTRFSYVLVEDCFFTDHHGDNDDVDLYGESTPPPLIKNNLFLNPAHDDMINPTRCSAVIIGNIVAGCDDHGIVLRDKCSPILINNLIYDCSSAGIAVQNQCNALLINNTIYDCARGVRFFDHTGRRGPPYCLYPGSGSATLINNIIWDCPTPLQLADSPYPEDRGSHATVLYCNIEGGQNKASVSSHSTLTWGEGNIDEDPLFADPASGDFHLKSTVGRWDASSQAWLTDDVDSPCIDAGIGYLVDDPNYAYTGSVDWRGELWPHGKQINIGAYGGTVQASLSKLLDGHVADCTNDGMIDVADLQRLAEQWLKQGAPNHADINRDQKVDFEDLAKLRQDWHWQE